MALQILLLLIYYYITVHLSINLYIRSPDVNLKIKVYLGLKQL